MSRSVCGGSTSTAPDPWFTAVGLAAVGGLVLGLATLPLQGVLSRWGDLANSGAVWSVGAFVAGMLLRGDTRRSAVAGAVVLVGAVLGYYGGARLLLPGPPTLGVPVATVAWAVVGCVAGPVFGVAGSWWRDERPIRRVASPAILGGAFIAEGLTRLIVLGYVREAAVAGMIGVLVPLVLGRTGRDRLHGLLALIPAGALGLGAFLLLEQVLELVFLHPRQ